MLAAELANIKLILRSVGILYSPLISFSEDIQNNMNMTIILAGLHGYGAQFTMVFALVLVNLNYANIIKLKLISDSNGKFLLDSQSIDRGELYNITL